MSCNWNFEIFEFHFYSYVVSNKEVVALWEFTNLCTHTNFIYACMLTSTSFPSVFSLPLNSLGWRDGRMRSAQVVWPMK